MKKKIIILANSIKLGGRCVAGVEMLNDDYTQPKLGKWIRPIDASQSSGTLHPSNTSVNGNQVQPLDIIEIEFIDHNNDPHHPEDWNIDTNVNWNNLGHYHESILTHMDFAEHDIWGGGKALAPGSLESTLQLIRISKPHTTTAGYETYNGTTKFKSYVKFDSEKGSYNASITDPAFGDRHNMGPMNVAEGELKYLELPIGTYMVMSVTPAWEKTGMQYKVIATIIEP